MKTPKKIGSFDCKMGWRDQDIRKCLFYGLLSQLDTPFFLIFPVQQILLCISVHNTKLIIKFAVEKLRDF